MSNKSSRQRFTEKQRGAVAAKQPTAAGGAEKGSRTFGQLMAKLWRISERQRSGVIVGLSFLTAATLLKLLPPAAIKIAVDYLLVDGALPVEFLNRWRLPHDRLALLLILSGIVVLISLVATFFQLWSKWKTTLAVYRLEVTMSKTAFDHAIRLPLNRVQDLKPGGVANLLRADAAGVPHLLLSMVYDPWQAIVQLVGSLVVLAFVDWKMLLFGLVIVPIVYFTHQTLINRFRPFWRDIREQLQFVYASTSETFGGVRIVRSFNRERSEKKRFVRESNLLMRHQLLTWWWTRVIEVGWTALIPVATTFVLAYGGYQILNARMTLGDLSMFLYFLAMLLTPLATIANTFTLAQNHLAGLDRTLDILEEPAEGDRNRETISLPHEKVKGALKFQGVCFSYPNSDAQILTGINIDVQPGETVALVGRSGAGKSTISNLAARFYDPTEGFITIDGHDLRDVKLKDYRRLLGVVDQDVFVFSGTVAENIGYSKNDASDEEIRNAAKHAHADEFIAELEDGYDTIVGNRGVRLSGGQRQRLSIARAILADPKILLLDEATSSLDSESEHMIQESLASLLTGRTCLVVAHRMSTIALADRIIVLHDGRIVKEGTHAELMQEENWYRAMVLLQTENLTPEL